MVCSPRLEGGAHGYEADDGDAADADEEDERPVVTHPARLAQPDELVRCYEPGHRVVGRQDGCDGAAARIGAEGHLPSLSGIQRHARSGKARAARRRGEGERDRNSLLITNGAPECVERRHGYRSVWREASPSSERSVAITS